MSLYAKVETQQKVREVHAESHAVCHGYLFPEGVEPEHAAGLVLIVVDGPDVSGVYKHGSFKYPEQFGAVFCGKIQAYVAALVYKVGYGVLGVERAGSECAHSPSSDAVGSAGVETLFERQYAGVAVWDSQPHASMERERMPGVEVAGV